MNTGDREINFFNEFPDSEPSDSDALAAQAVAGKLSKLGAAGWRSLGLDRLFGDPVGPSAERVKDSTAFWRCAWLGVRSAWLAGMVALFGPLVVALAIEGSDAFESIPIFLTLGLLVASVISVALGFLLGGVFGVCKAWGSAPKTMAAVGFVAWVLLFSHRFPNNQVGLWLTLATCLVLSVGAGWHFRRACLRDDLLNPEVLAV